MNSYQRYENQSHYTCARASTDSVHAPAYFQETELTPSSAWSGHQSRSSAPHQQAQSQAPIVQRTPMNFGTTTGYYQNGCWYNARLQKHPVAQVVVQSPPASPQQQQQQHLPQYYIAAQPGQQEHLTSSYPLQQQALLPSYSSQSQQRQISHQAYQSQQQQQILPQLHQSQLVMSPSYDRSQQQQLVVLSAYPSQRQQQPYILQSCPYHQQRQILPQLQQLVSPSCPSQLQQITQQQHAVPSQPTQLYTEAGTASHGARTSPLVAAPEVAQGQTAPQIAIEEESPNPQEPQEPQEVEAAPEPQENEPQNVPKVVEINLGPGVQATKSHNKLTIDIDLSHVDNAMPERRRTVDDVMSELVQLIRVCVFRNPRPRRRRNRLRLRRPCPVIDVVRHVTVADKATQTEIFEAANQMDTLSAEAAESLQESPSSSRTLVQEEDLSLQPVASSTLILLQEELLSEPSASSSPRILIQEEHSSEQPVAVAIDFICDQVFECLTDSEQQSKDTSKSAKKPSPPMNSPRREPKRQATAPLLFPEPKQNPIDDTSSWPPLGTRAPTKASLVKKSISINATKNRSSSTPSETPKKDRGNCNDTTFQPKQILRNLERYKENIVKSNGGISEAGVQKVQNVNSHALKKAAQHRSLSSAMAKDLQDKKHSLAGRKQQQQPESKLIVGNMFALLDEPGNQEPPPPETKAEAEAAGEEKDHVDLKKLASRKAKKQKRKLKRKEKARAVRLEAKEKAAKVTASAVIKKVKVKSPTKSPKRPSSPGLSCVQEEKPFEMHFMGELQVTGLPTIDKKDMPLKFLLFQNSGQDVAGEPPTETNPVEGRDPAPSAEIPVEKNEQLPSLGAKKGRSHSHFLDAVKELTSSMKTAEGHQLPAKRNLWEKRRITEA